LFYLSCQLVFKTSHLIFFIPLFLLARTPGFVATFIVRTKLEVDAAGDHRELGPLALYVPVFSFLNLVCIYYSHKKENTMVLLQRKQHSEKIEDNEDEAVVISESSSLIVNKKDDYETLLHKS